MMREKIKAILITGVFLLALSLPLFTLNLTGAEFSPKENRMLADTPTLFLENGQINPNLGGEMKRWLEDHIGLRDQFVELNARLKFNVLNQSPSSLVHVGKDGWYFYTNDENLQISNGTYTLPPEMLEEILQCHLRIRDKLAARGIEYVIMLPTSKVSIYPEYMRYGDEEIRETPVDTVADYLEAHSDLKVIRLKDALLEEKENQQVFYKTDTHWNQAGAYAAYRETINRMNEWGLCSKEPVDVEWVETTFTGEFGAMMGSHQLLEPETTYNTVIPNAAAYQDVSTERSMGMMDLVKQKGIQYECYHYVNDSVEEPSLLLFGDSMFAHWNATELLAENFSELSYIRSYYIYEEYLDYLTPDVVIYEMTERYQNVFSQYVESFAKQPLSEHEAEIVSYELRGDVLEVTVKNTSNSAWQRIDQVRCGILVNGQDIGRRAYLDRGVIIQPGESVVFSFENAKDFMTENMEATMLQEGICYFGEREPLFAALNAEIVSHTAPATVNCTDGYSFRITVKNTGTETWSESKQIRLCIWQDGTDYGYRIYLPDGVEVAPGEEYTFELRDFRMPEPRSTAYAFQMLKECVCYFGEKERFGITSVQSKEDTSQTILNQPMAEIVSYKILPDKDGLSIRVTAKNTGSEPWSEEDMIRMCIWYDGKDSARFFLLDGVIVAPGEQYTFALDGFVLPGESTVVEFQMLQETIQYFGEKEMATIALN